MKRLLSEEVEQVMSLLETAGFEVFVVGGAVRDFCMGIIPADVDLATNATPEQMKTIFEEFTLIETGIRHGTITIRINQSQMEVTTYRIESDYMDCRHPDFIEFTSDLKQDLIRRDFTINAMAYHPSKGIIDPFGGQEDIQNKLIRCVGEPSKRLTEDALRILRALRFSSVLGFTIEMETSKAMFKHKDQLKHIASERIQQEMSKMLIGDGVKSVIISYIDIIGVFIPELLAIKNFVQYTKYHHLDVLTHTAVTLEHTPKETMLRWVMLLHDIAKPVCFTMDKEGAGHFYGHNDVGSKMAEDILIRLRFDKVTRNRIVMLISLHDKFIEPQKVEVAKLMSRLGVKNFWDLLEVKYADNKGKAPEYQQLGDYFAKIKTLALQIMEDDECLTLAQLEVDGYDLLNLGYEREAIGETLTRLLNAVLKQEVNNRKEELLRYLEIIQNQ